MKNETDPKKSNLLPIIVLILGLPNLVAPLIAFFSFGTKGLIAILLIALVTIVLAFVALKQGGGKVKSLIGLFGGILGVVSAIILLLFIQTQKNATLPTSSLDEAEKQLFMRSSDTVAFGNAEEAIAVSTKIATALEVYLAGDEIDEKPTGMSMNGENVAVYTSFQPANCVVLLTIPRFKKYSEEHRDKIYSKAWQETATTLAASKLIEKDAALAIAIRSGISYGGIYHGKISDSDSLPTKTDDEDVLVQMFTTGKE